MIARIAAPVRTWQRFVLLGLLLGALLVGNAETLGARKLDSLTFVKAEVPLVLKALADISGANIVIASGVQGSITLNLKDVTVEEALDIITKMSGLSYAYTNGAYLVGAADAPKQVMQYINREYLIIEAVDLALADVQNALSVTFPDVAVKQLTPSNKIVLVGKKDRLEAAMTFLDEVWGEQATDDPGAQEIEYGEATYRVKSSVPWQVKLFLEQSYGEDGLNITYGPSAVAPANATPSTTWTSDLLILRGPKDVVSEALASLEKVDEEVPYKEVRTRAKRIFGTQAIAYLLQNFEARGLTITTAPMTASDIALITGEGNPVVASTKVGNIGIQVKQDAAGKLNITEPVGDFILNGPEKVVAQALAALETIDIGQERTVRVCNLRFIQATDAKKQLEELFKTEGLFVTMAPGLVGDVPRTGGAAAVVAGVEINDLILRGPEDVVARAAQLLTDLDVQPPQVSISTEIISVDSSQVKNLGVQWSGVSGDTATAGVVTVGLTEQPNPDVFTLGRIVRSQLEFNAAINALVSRNKAKVINRPSTVIQNGRQASIHVGNQIYYEQLTGYSSTGLPIFSTTSVDSGVTMKVRPLVSRDGTITLEIQSEVTDPPTFKTGASGAELPILSKSESTTVVKIRNGETLVIGGLVQNRSEEIRTEIPVLSKIPLLGKLFTNTKTSPSQSELLIMVTPRLMDGEGTTPAAPAAAPVTE